MLVFYVFIYTALCVIYLLALERGSHKPQLHGGATAYSGGEYCDLGGGKLLQLLAAGIKHVFLRVFLEVVVGCNTERKGMILF
jgi:hypothetical protein